jgi:hypothetical protein
MYIDGSLHCLASGRWKMAKLFSAATSSNTNSILSTNIL